MKALELLRQYQYADDCLSGLMAIELKEAIEELEKLENKSCDGCKYDEKDDSYPTICWECSRYYTDRYESKDK